MNNEDDFRRGVVRQAEQWGAHVTHIESHQTSAGVTDLNIWAFNRDLWLELKVVKRGTVKLRPTQKKWHRERAEAGGQSWVAVLDPKTQHVLVLRGEAAATLPPGLASWEAAAVIRTHSASWSWLAIIAGRVM